MTSNPHRIPDGRANRIPDGRANRRERARWWTLPVAEDTAKLLTGFAKAQRRHGLTEATIATRRNKLLYLARWVYPKSLLAATPKHIEEMLDVLGIQPRTRYAYISNLHAFYDWLLGDRRIALDPTARMQRPRYPRVVARPIPDDELADAFKWAPPDIKAMIALAAYQGLRAGEIANLSRDDILETNDPPVLIVTRGKGGHARVLPLHPEVLPALRLVPLPRTGRVFLKADESPLAGHNVSHAVNNYLHNIGIASSIHSLRHWAGTKLYGASKDLRTVQALLGHSSPSTTMMYVAFSAVDAVNAVNALHIGRTDERTLRLVDEKPLGA